jgi:hypothetical protein
MLNSTVIRTDADRIISSLFTYLGHAKVTFICLESPLHICMRTRVFLCHQMFPFVWMSPKEPRSQSFFQISVDM